MPSLPGTNWEGLTSSEQDTFVDAVKQLFLASDQKTYVRYNPVLSTARPIYRPLQKLPKSVITTLLSGHQELVSLDETGESTQWAHVFSEKDGIASVTFVHHSVVETSRKKPRNSRSRSRSRAMKSLRKKENRPRSAAVVAQLHLLHRDSARTARACRRRRRRRPLLHVIAMSDKIKWPTFRTS